MAAAVFFAGATRFLLSVHQNTKEKYQEIEELTAVSTRAFYRAERERRTRAARGSGSA
jgi:hypothetical protein